MSLQSKRESQNPTTVFDRNLPAQDKVLLSAIQDTLRDQKSEFTPAAYFAALLSLLSQYVSSNDGIINKEVATSVVHLLDLIGPEVPKPLLRSKFTQTLQTLAPALLLQQAEAPFIRAAIGFLVSLLLAQDAPSWSLPQSQTSPRQALSSLLALSGDHRPKVRKRAQQGLATVLEASVPGPSLDHPAADMCAETALRSFEQLARSSGQSKLNAAKTTDGEHHEPKLIHSMQLIKVIAAACKGWPSKNLESLCEVLFAVARSSSTFLTMTAFEVFESIFEGMVDDASSSKLPRLLEAVYELQPSQSDSQLVPPWIAIISRAQDVSAQVEPEETFQKLPDVFEKISNFLASSSYNIRVSAAECLISFLVNCVPTSAILEPSIYDTKTFEKLAGIVDHLLTVKYQPAWMEVFTVVGAMFDNLHWQAWPVMRKALATIGSLRTNESFAGKEQADEVVAKAIRAIGPKFVLEVLPLNLVNPKHGQQGKAWMLPLLRDNISNTELAHFKMEMVPLSEKLFHRVANGGQREKTMEMKIFETIIQQIWACLPGYCDRPLDTISAFDQGFAEMLSNVLYQQLDMRLTVCRALRDLVESYKVIAEVEGDEDLILQGRISKDLAAKSLDHLSTFASNFLAVLFNVYTETLPQRRGPVLNCIDSFLSITKPAEIASTFERVATMLDEQLKQSDPKPTKQKHDPNAPPPVTHALMDLIVAIAIYLPRDSFSALFGIASSIISQQAESQLQKKAYKLIPRLATSTIGREALAVRSVELQNLLLANSDRTLQSARKDRLSALVEVVGMLPANELHFIPAILPEVILCAKETNERAREAAYELIIAMGEKMAAGGTVDNSKVPHLEGVHGLVPASIDEYFTMLSAGLAGSSPHMISATVTALSRALFHFKADLSDSLITDMISTMDLFLQSPTREVVRSVLGFVKVCVVTLPKGVMAPRLPTLIPNLLTWSKEHKAHFRAKVKNILERMIRHYGVETVEMYTPDADRKLISNIRKTRERNKRKKKGGDGEDEGESAGEEGDGQKTKTFSNEFDEAIYGSDDDDENQSSSDEDVQMRDKNSAQAAVAGKKGRQQRKQHTYIHEDEDEPLDLLDKKALANISSTKPVKARAAPKRHKATYDEDGRLVLNGDDNDNENADEVEGHGKGGRNAVGAAKRRGGGGNRNNNNNNNGGDADRMEVDGGGDDGMVEPGDDATLENGINAYLEAIRGRDAPTRGRGGRLKFSNRRAMEGRVEKTSKKQQQSAPKSPRGRGKF